MTSLSLLVLIVFNFVLVGLLPVFFFRRDGDFNLRWVATGAPFFVAPFALVLGYLEILQPTDDLSVAGAAVLQGCATLLSATSIGLIAMTAASHRVPLALWHRGDDDALMRDAAAQSRVTHAHPRSQICCADVRLLRLLLYRAVYNGRPRGTTPREIRVR